MPRKPLYYDSENGKKEVLGTSGSFEQVPDAPTSALPTEYPATYAAMQASITSDPTTKRDFFVTADETNGGGKTSYRYDGIDVKRVGDNPSRELIIDPCNISSLWAVFSGSGTAAVDTSDFEHRQSLSFSTSVAGSPTSFRRDVQTSLLKGGGFLFRIKRDANLSALDINIRCGSFSAEKVFTTNMGVSAMPVGEWYNLVIPLSYFGKPVGASVSTFARVKQIDIKVTPTAGNNSTLYIANIKALSSSFTPKVVFQFDDGKATTYSRAYPVLSANGYKGSVPVEYNAVGTANRMTLAQLQELYNAGWEMNGHYTGQIQNDTEANQLTVLRAAKDFLLDNGFTKGASHWVWPGGARNITADKVARRLYKTRRSTGPMVSYAIPSYYDGYDPNIYYIAGNPSLASIKTVVDNVSSYGGAVVFVFHDIVADGGIVVTEDWEVSNFTALVQYCASKGLQSSGYDELFGTLTP